jgi:uncharacterized protein (DUF1919 family)
MRSEVFINVFRRILRYAYRQKLKNKNITLITNNCIGGIIYHDMHLPFLTPTINLYFDNEEFITFCTFLEEYLLLPVEEYTAHSKPFPVGVLRGKHGDVHVFFMHYDSFESAIKKWEDRKRRIDWENLYIVMESQQCDKTTLAKFNNIPYKNKVVLTDGETGIANSFPIKSEFYANNYWPGKLLEYPPYALLRYMDKFDYVNFFNTGRIRRRYV